MAEWYPKERLGDLPAEAARRWGAREALVCDGARWTYREFDREVDRVAKGLMALGVEKGEHVALWMNNRPEWLFLVFAIAKIGAVLVPLNTRYRTEDVAYTVRQSDSGTWISIDRSGPVDYAAMLADVLPGLAAQDPRGANIEGFPRLRRLVVVGESDVPGTLGWEAMLAGGEPVSDAALAVRAGAVDPDEPVMIGYTSGTTGHPKGVLHTHVMIRNMRERANRIGLTFEDVIINPLPLFHMYGFSEAGLIAVIAGCKHVLLGPLRCRRVHAAGRSREGHDHPRLRYPLQGISRFARTDAAGYFQPALRHLPLGHDELRAHRAAGADRDAAHLHRLGHDRDLHLRHHVLRKLDA